MDITHRGDFDKAVSERFPKARRSRKELATGWEDIIEVGFLHISIRVWDTKKTGSRGPDVDTLIITIGAIRTALDRSVTSGLWRREAEGWDAACEALDDLREQLLGVSHGLAHACGRAKTRPLVRRLLPKEAGRFSSSDFR